MLAKHTFAALIAVMAHGATAAFNSSCSWWYIHEEVTLTGDCVDSTSSNKHRVVSNLDLNECIGIDSRANALIWQPNGQAFRMDPKGDRMFCADCSLQSSAIVMQCDCVNEFAGRTSSSVNLNDRITVNEQGWLTC